MNIHKENSMKTDIEIAQEAQMLPITEVVKEIGLTADDLELYGKYKAKISNEYLKKIEGNKKGKLILVTAINPTPAGEGKTTTSVGLGQAFGKLGKRRSSHCVSHLSVRASGSKAVQRAAVMHRSFRWKI